jgi:hypothetical protein
MTCIALGDRHGGRSEASEAIQRNGWCSPTNTAGSTIRKNTYIYNLKEMAVVQVSMLETNSKKIMDTNKMKNSDFFSDSCFSCQSDLFGAGTAILQNQFLRCPNIFRFELAFRHPRNILVIFLWLIDGCRSPTGRHWFHRFTIDH